MIQQTSLQAFNNISLNGKLSKNENIVLWTFREMIQATNNEVANRLGWSINRVTGRTNSLVKKNKLKYICKRRCKITGYNSIVWGLTR